MDGSESAVFKGMDTIRINKLGANDSGFCVLSHDVGQKPFAFGAPGRNRSFGVLVHIFALNDFNSFKGESYIKQGFQGFKK